jgi:hypothetical protein
MGFFDQIFQGFLEQLTNLFFNGILAQISQLFGL